MKTKRVQALWDRYEHERDCLKAYAKKLKIGNGDYMLTIHPTRKEAINEIVFEEEIKKKMDELGLYGIIVIERTIAYAHLTDSFFHAHILIPSTICNEKVLLENFRQQYRNNKAVMVNTIWDICNERETGLVAYLAKMFKLDYAPKVIKYSKNFPKTTIEKVEEKIQISSTSIKEKIKVFINRLWTNRVLKSLQQLLFTKTSPVCSGSFLFIKQSKHMHTAREEYG